MNGNRPIIMDNMFELSVIVPEAEAAEILNEIKDILQNRFKGDQISIFSWVQQYCKLVGNSIAFTNKHKMMFGLCPSSLLINQPRELGGISDVENHIGFDIGIKKCAHDMEKASRKLDL